MPRDDHRCHPPILAPCAARLDAAPTPAPPNLVDNGEAPRPIAVWYLPPVPRLERQIRDVLVLEAALMAPLTAGRQRHSLATALPADLCSSARLSLAANEPQTRSAKQKSSFLSSS